MLFFLEEILAPQALAARPILPGGGKMFPTPIEKSSRSWQVTYQALLPVALILWLLPLIAVMIFSVKPAADFTTGNYWGAPSSFESVNNYGRAFFESDMPK